MTPQVETTPTPTLIPGTGNIDIFVWQDLNHNGIYEAGESMIAGVLVQAFAAEEPTPGSSGLSRSAGPVAECTTAATGHCTLVGLIPGLYRVQETNPQGLSSTTPDSVIVRVEDGRSVSAHFGDGRYTLYLPIVIK